MNTPEHIVDILLEGEDIDWSHDPEDPDYPQDFKGYVSKAHPILVVFEQEGFEKEEEEYWYLTLNVDTTPIGRYVPRSLQVLVDPRIGPERKNELGVTLFYTVPVSTQMSQKTIISLSQFQDGRDEAFAEVIRSVTRAAKEAAKIKATSVTNPGDLAYANANAYAQALMQHILRAVPDSYRHRTEGFLHYWGRAE